MKNFTLIKISYIFFFLFLLFTSCEKKQEPDLLPDWLKEIIDERNQDGICYFTSAMRYQWQGQCYFELFSPVSSCFRCDVFDESGERIIWETYAELEDYEINRKDESIIWVCEM